MEATTDARPSAPPRNLPPIRGIRMGWTEEPRENVQMPKNDEIPLITDAIPLPEDHSPVEGESSAPLTPEVELMRENTDEYQLDERPRSAGSSSLSSRSSKRTSISAELTSNIRQRVRQQAVRNIAQKRGSVQLAKRLLRSQTLQIAPDELETEEDQEAIDHQIEESLKLGEKYTRTTTKSALAPEHVQKAFFEFEDAEIIKPPETKSHVIFGKPKPCRSAETEKFGQLLTSYGRKALSISVEDPIAKLDNIFFASKPGRDYSMLAQRLGSTFSTQSGSLNGLEELVTNKPLKLDRDEDEDFLLVEYAKAQNWEEWEKQKGRHIGRYFQFNIDVNRIEFDHHWLFSKEDSLAKEVENLHRELGECGDNALELMQNYLRIQQRHDTLVLDEEEKTRLSEEMATTEKEFQEEFLVYRKLAGLLENSWQKLVQQRETQKVSTANLVLEKVENHTTDLGDIPEAFQPFVSYPTFVLKEVQTKEKKLEKIESERQAAIGKCRIQILIYFNEILVCKTKPVPLNKNFNVKIVEVYSLRVFERPEQVTLVIMEKFGRFGWREVASVFVPVPVEIEDHPWDASRHKGSMGSGDPNYAPFIQGRLYCKSVWIDSDLGHKLHEKKREVLKESEAFELIPPETRLVSDEEFVSDIRLEALSHRFSRQLTDKHGTKWIGLTSAEVDHGWLADEFKMEDRPRIGGLEFSSIDVFRRAGNKYAAMIRS